MLAEIEPRQFDEWLAMHNIEPWGDDWQQAGTIASVLSNCIVALAASFGGEKVNEEDLSQPTDYYRPEPRRNKTKLRYLTPEESLRRHRLMCGV